jgi:hypothetical protein
MNSSLRADILPPFVNCYESGQNDTKGKVNPMRKKCQKYNTGTV